jgi:hypothetical protein
MNLIKEFSVNLRYIFVGALMISAPVLALAVNSPMYNKYYSSDKFTFNGRNFENLSEEFAHSQYSAKDPDSKFLINESGDDKYRFDYSRETAGEDNLVRFTEATSTGSGDKRYITASTATFYKNDKLRARTICASENGESAVHCATATQKSCIGILEKYQSLTKASKGHPALLSSEPAENDKNMKSCQNLLQGYAEIANASQKYLNTESGFNKVAERDTEAVQQQMNRLFGKKALLFSNISVKENNVDTTLKLGAKASETAEFASSPAGLGLIQHLVQTCRESIRDFDANRVDGTAARNAASKLKGGQTAPAEGTH